MFKKKVFALFIVISGFLKVYGDDCRLKLSQVFRTPKDFSKVNFDNFEILERNNFDSSSENPDPNPNDEICKCTQTVPKSIANAQIMLRFGGDDIHGKNHLGTTGKIITKPIVHYHPSPNHACQHSEIRHPPFPFYPPEIYPVPPHPPSVSMPTYAPSFPGYCPYPPPPPFSFPGYYYHHMHNHPHHPHQVPTDLINAMGSQRSVPFECPKHLNGDFLEFQNGGLQNHNHPVILTTRNLSNDAIEEAPCTDDSKNPTVSQNENKTVCILEAPSLQSSKKENIRPVTIVKEFKHSRDTGLNTGHVLDIHDNEEHLKVQPLVGNDITEIPESPKEQITVVKPLVIEEPPVPSVDAAKPLPDDSSLSNVETWLNGSLVPYEYNTKCEGQQKRLLVSYPVTNNPEEPRPVQEDIEPNNTINTCSCILHKGYCNCANCNRKPNIPFGKRFPADMDALHQLVHPLPVSYDHLGGHISTGYTSAIEHGGYSDYEQIGNEKPIMLMNEYSISSGAGFHSDPIKEVYYKEPTMVDIMRGSNYNRPHFTHTKLVEPHYYQVVPKYNIIPKEVPSLDIPDLVSTNKFMCTCNPSHHHSRYGDIERPPVYCPVHGHVPYSHYHPVRTLVVDVPYERSSSYNNDHFLGYINDPRGIQ